MLIDTHAHLYWDTYEQDLGDVIQRSLDASVSTIINVGVDVKLSKKALEQAQDKLANIPGLKVYSTIAIHPQEAPRYARSKLFEPLTTIETDIEKLEKIYKANPEKVVAVGECGLDYMKVDEKIKNLQRELFKAHIGLAKKLDLPLVVHCRDDRSNNPTNSEAWDIVLEMIGNYPAILHCYSGLSHTTNYILQTTNLLVSFAGNITYPKNEYLREAIRILPMEKILLETDSPFLAPQSKRGQRNEPSSVREIAQLIAEIKGISFEEVAEQTTENARRIFNI